MGKKLLNFIVYLEELQFNQLKRLSKSIFFYIDYISLILFKSPLKKTF